MGEDPADDPGILNGREQPHAPPTARAREHVKLEGAPHEVRPRPRARLAGSFLLELRDAARARVNSACFHQRGLRALVGHGAGAPASMGGQRLPPEGLTGAEGAVDSADLRPGKNSSTYSSRQAGTWPLRATRRVTTRRARPLTGVEGEATAIYLAKLLKPLVPGGN